MSSGEKKMIETIASAFQVLPDEKKEYLLGYAEGVAAMAAQKASAENAENGKE